MKHIICLCTLLFFCTSLLAQDKEVQTIVDKKESRKNLVVKEWNSEGDGKRAWLDHVTVYNADGLKIEEIEYASYGMKERTTYEYNPEGKCIKEVVYNDKNKVYRVRKYEYDTEGRKKTQYNYTPNGKLYSVKRFEYTTTDQANKK